MIRTLYNLNKQKEENIIRILDQTDNVQRVGVLTMNQEKQIILRAGKAARNTLEREAKIADKEIVEQKREREVLDLIDQKRALDKEIRKNNEKLQELSKENKELYNILKQQQEEEKPKQTQQTKEEQ